MKEEKLNLRRLGYLIFRRLQNFSLKSRKFHSRKTIVSHPDFKSDTTRKSEFFRKGEKLLFDSIWQEI